MALAGRPESMNHVDGVAHMQPDDRPEAPLTHYPMPPRFDLDQDLPEGRAQRRLRLNGQPYQNLINVTIDSFRLADDRRQEQDEARVALHKILIEHTGRTFPFHRPPPPHKAPSLSGLRKFMRLADKYFFMGACYSRPDGPDLALRALEGVYNRPGDQFSGPAWTKGVMGQTAVQVSMGLYWDMGKRERLHAHMYTHALMALCGVYLHTYACWCREECLPRIFDTNGFTDRGLAYQTLLGHIMKHIRLWDPRLRKFGLDLVDKYCIHRSGWEDEDYKYRQVYQYEEEHPGACVHIGLEKLPHPNGIDDGLPGRPANQKLRVGTEKEKYGISLVHRENHNPNLPEFQGPDLTLSDNTGSKKRKRDLAALDKYIQDSREVRLPNKRARRDVNYRV